MKNCCDYKVVECKFPRDEGKQQHPQPALHESKVQLVQGTDKDSLGGSIPRQRALAQLAGLPRQLLEAQDWSISIHRKMSKCVRRVAWLQWVFLTEPKQEKEAFRR